MPLSLYSMQSQQKNGNKVVHRYCQSSTQKENYNDQDNSLPRFSRQLDSLNDHINTRRRSVYRKHDRISCRLDKIADSLSKISKIIQYQISEPRRPSLPPQYIYPPNPPAYYHIIQPTIMPQLPYFYSPTYSAVSPPPPLPPLLSTPSPSISKIILTHQNPRHSQIKKSSKRIKTESKDSDKQYTYHSRLSTNSRINHCKINSIIARRAAVKNRFKICAMAVYFIFAFRNYRQKFTQLRHKWFIEKYKTQKYLKQHYSAMQQKLRYIDIREIYRDSKNQSIECFLDILVSEIFSRILQKPLIEEHYEILSFGLLNNNFYIEYEDHYLYLPEEEEIFQISGAKCKLTKPDISPILKLNEQCEFLLLISRLIKIVVYGYLWRTYLDSQPSMKDQIGIITVFFHEVMTDIFKKGIDNLKTSFPQIRNKKLSRKSVISQLFSKSSKTNSNLSSIHSIFSERQQQQQQKGLHYDNKIPFSYIKQMPNYRQHSIGLKRDRQLIISKDKITKKVIDFVNELKKFVKNEEKKVYLHIRQACFQLPKKEEQLKLANHDSNFNLTSKSSIFGKNFILKEKFESQKKSQVISSSTKLKFKKALTQNLKKSNFQRIQRQNTFNYPLKRNTFKNKSSKNRLTEVIFENNDE